MSIQDFYKILFLDKSHNLPLISANGQISLQAQFQWVQYPLEVWQSSHTVKARKTLEQTTLDLISFVLKVLVAKKI